MPRTVRIVPARPWRLAGVLGGGALLLWVTVGATLAQVTARRSPAASMDIWPVAAAPRANLAGQALTDDQSPAAMKSAQALALGALMREPVNAVAARVAASTSGNDRTAQRLLNYAERLSRRDLYTQVALIETSVAANDVAGALRHYDTALRTGDAADQLLMPVLVAASRDPQVAHALGPLLARRPPWRMRYVYSLLTTPPWPPTFMGLIEAAHLDVGDALGRDFLSRAAKGLVGNGALNDAARLYARATGGPVTATVRNGSFAGEDRIQPFDWDITDEPGLGAVKGPVDDAPFPGALSINVDPGRSGIVAKQLLLLPAGRYRLHFVAGSVPVGGPDRSSVVITCNGSNTLLTSVRLPQGPRPRAAEAGFVVPEACSGQWFTIQAGSDLDAPRGDSPSPWISGISISRA